MMSLVMGQVAISLLMGVERPLHWLRSYTGMWAGIRQGKTRSVVRFELAVTPEEFDRLIETPGFLEAFSEARRQKEIGLVGTCSCCGAAIPAGEREKEN